jgi:hypothetical protein
VWQPGESRNMIHEWRCRVNFPIAILLVSNTKFVFSLTKRQKLCVHTILYNNAHVFALRFYLINPCNSKTNYMTLLLHKAWCSSLIRCPQPNRLTLLGENCVIFIHSMKIHINFLISKQLYQQTSWSLVLLGSVARRSINRNAIILPLKWTLIYNNYMQWTHTIWLVHSRAGSDLARN